MFREMRRIKQQITEAECIEVLKKEMRGVLSVMGEDGYPYGMPMDFYYNETDGHIYYHGAKSGHKIDAIRANDKVSFCVFEKEGFIREGEWAWNVKSVIIFGRMKEVTDTEKAKEIARSIGYKYTTDSAYVEREVAESTRNVLCLELIPEHMTGKQVNES